MNYLASYSHSLEILVTNEVDQQLQALPNEVKKSINKTVAINQIIRFFHPLNNKHDQGWENLSHQTSTTLQSLISDFTTLSLFRLVCQTQDYRR
jgi:predicted PurR-regulated permease PerM